MTLDPMVAGFWRRESFQVELNTYIAPVYLVNPMPSKVQPTPGHKPAILSTRYIRFDTTYAADDLQGWTIVHPIQVNSSQSTTESFLRLTWNGFQFHGTRLLSGSSAQVVAHFPTPRRVRYCILFHLNCALMRHDSQSSVYLAAETKRCPWIVPREYWPAIYLSMPPGNLGACIHTHYYIDCLNQAPPSWLKAHFISEADGISIFCRNSPGATSSSNLTSEPT